MPRLRLPVQVQVQAIVEDGEAAREEEEEEDQQQQPPLTHTAIKSKWLCKIHPKSVSMPSVQLNVFHIRPMVSHSAVAAVVHRDRKHSTALASLGNFQHFPQDPGYRRQRVCTLVPIVTQ